jgi:predicted N-acyltransferase
MGQLGVHFAISSDQAEALKSVDDDDSLMALVEGIENDWENAFETDKGWDALHRCLSDGTLDGEGGEPPLNQVFFGGEMLNQDDDYFVVLTTPKQVQAIAKALAKVDAAWLKKRYWSLDFPDYDAEKSEDDLQYAIDQFAGLPEFFAKAAKAKQYVVFTVSQ